MSMRCVSALSCNVENRVDEYGNDISIVESFCVAFFGDVRDPFDDMQVFDDVESTVSCMCALSDSMGDDCPIFACVNLALVLYPLASCLESMFDLEVMARNQADVMTLDALDCDGNRAFRLWDCKQFVNGCEEPDGSLESFENHVSAIVSGLRSVVDENSLFVSYKDLGVSVITRTSLVRIYAKRIIGNLRYTNSHGNKVTVRNAFDRTCKQEFFKFYDEYRYAKSSFNGGFTFVSAVNAGKVLGNTVCLDAVSMHHAFINGRFFPVKFSKADLYVANVQASRIVNISADEVLEYYHDPISYFFNACIRFIGLRLKPGSAFERFHIGLISQSRFSDRISDVSEFGINERARIVDEDMRKTGFVNTGTGLSFAFGKLMSAQDVRIFCDENELWNISRVYEWDFMEVLEAYDTAKRMRPPDYLTLQSNMLYDKKKAAKARCESNKGYENEYVSNVKSMFNSIYGTQVQDVMKPDFKMCDDSIDIDSSDIPTERNFDELKPDNPSTLFNFGSRVSSAARMHLVLAIEMLHNRFGDDVSIVSGDTDSIYVNTELDAKELEQCLEPLHEAAQRAIDFTLARCRREFPNQCCNVSDVGMFQADSKREKMHYEFACKTRIVQYGDGEVSVTAAGVPRDSKYVSIVDKMIGTHGFAESVMFLMNYNLFMSKDVCSAVTVEIPRFGTSFDGKPKTLCYRDESMIMGSSFKPEYRHSIGYMLSVCGRRDVEVCDIGLEHVNGVFRAIMRDESGRIRLLECSDGEVY